MAGDLEYFPIINTTTDHGWLLVEREEEVGRFFQCYLARLSSPNEEVGTHCWRIDGGKSLGIVQHQPSWSGLGAI